MKVSVVICTYNGARFIAEQLESIFRQTRQPDEIILCDDQSTDPTVELASARLRDSGIAYQLVCNPENVGYIRNFSQGISLAEGDVIFLCDQDDVWFEDRIERMLEPFAASAHVGLVYSDALIVDDQLQPLGTTVFATREIANLAAGPARDVREVVLSVDIKGCLLAFRREFRSVVLPIPAAAIEAGWGHDHWLAQIVWGMSKVAVVNAPLMQYRRNLHSAGCDQILLRGRNRDNIFRRLVGARQTQGEDFSATTMTKVTNLTVVRDRLEAIRRQSWQMIADKEYFLLYLETFNTIIKMLTWRCSLRQAPLTARFLPATSVWLSGGYRRYFSGSLSYLRDILFP